MLRKRKKDILKNRNQGNENPVVPQLNLPDDAEMLEDFGQEAQRYLTSARNSLLVLESVPNDQEALDSIFKAFHTIKGLADFLKLSDIHRLTLATEALLDLLRKEILDADNQIFALLNKVIDQIQVLLELLDKQIKNGGKFRGRYPSSEQLIGSLHAKSKGSNALAKTAPETKISDQAVADNADQITNEIIKKLSTSEKVISLKRETATQWLAAVLQLNTELKECQKKLQDRQRELIREREVALRLTQNARQEARLKSDYLAHMAHEIRTLLSAIMGFTDLLKNGELPDKQREHLNTIIWSGNMMFEIVNHILDYAKVEAGKLTFEQIDFNLDRIIEDVFRVIRPRLVKKPIELYFSINERVPRNLKGDPTRVKQIFINLLDNAIKFTEKGEIGLEVSLEKLAAPPALAQKVILKFIIKDTGIGLPPDRLEHIFESFTQASESTTRLYGGSGLGLALCKSFINAMGGDITVESKLGLGSRFIFTLALTTSHSPDIPAENPEFAGSLILIVDNHETSLKTLQALCQRFKLSLLTSARSAKQATEFLLKLENERKPLPSIIFVDTLLPEQEGFLLAKKIRQQQRYRQIKLVGISSDVKIASSPEFLQAGFDFFLAKPFISGEVANVLSQVLREKLPEPLILSPAGRDKSLCKGIRILAVEDSLPNRELLKVHFDALGCICDYAKNGKEAIERLKTGNYAVCFMDLQMPFMGGLEATKIIRQQLKSTVPIVALTAAEFQEEKDKCYEVGMNDYLTKPFGQEQLKEKILKCTKN